MPKKKPAKKPAKPTQFRLTQDTLDDLDHVKKAAGLTTRTEAVRHSARKAARDYGKDK